MLKLVIYLENASERVGACGGGGRHGGVSVVMGGYLSVGDVIRINVLDTSAGTDKLLGLRIYPRSLRHKSESNGEHSSTWNRVAFTNQ